MDIKSFFYKYKILIAFAFMAIITSTVYVQVIHHGFISFDDNYYVEKNEHVNKGVSIESIIWAFSIPERGEKTYWHPLTFVSHMIDCQLFGLNAGMHHVMNLIIHILNALLLFFMLKKMTDEFWKSAIVALLFALHPVNVDSVAWLAERKNLLSTFFWMLTITVYLYYVEKQRLSWYILTLIVFTLGLLSKPMLVTLPFVLLLLDLWPLKRIRFDGVQGETGLSKSVTALFGEQGATIKRLILEKIPFLVLSIFSIGISMISIKRIGATITLDMVPLGLRIENAFVAYLRYIYKFVWPSDLTFFYPFPKQVPFWQVIAAVLVLSAATWGAVKTLKKHPYFLVGWLWFLGTLVPVSGITQGGLWPAIAERWAYVPYIGLFISLAWGAGYLISGMQYRKAVAVCITVILLVSLSLRTWSQVHCWKDNFSFFSHGIEVDPENVVAYNGLGGVYWDKKDSRKAIEYFRRAIQLAPDYFDPHYNLGAVLGNMGDTDGAIQEYLEAIRCNPNFVEPYVRLGTIYLRQDKVTEAMRYISLASRLAPGSQEVSNIIGAALAKSGNAEDAYRYFLKSIERDPKNAFAYNNLGVLSMQMNNMDEAIRYFSSALKINPKYVEAHKNLGVILNDRGELDEAVSHFQEAVRTDPGNDDVHYKLGVIYLKRGNIEESGKHLGQAVKIKPNDARYRYAYSLYLVSMDRLDDAIVQLQEAVRLNKDYPEAQKLLIAARSRRHQLEKPGIKGMGKI